MSLQTLACRPLHRAIGGMRDISLHEVVRTVHVIILHTRLRVHSFRARGCMSIHAGPVAARPFMLRGCMSIHVGPSAMRPFVPDPEPHIHLSSTHGCVSTRPGSGPQNHLSRTRGCTTSHPIRAGPRVHLSSSWALRPFVPDPDPGPRIH